jgi:hypothetical protein
MGPIIVAFDWASNNSAVRKYCTICCPGVVIGVGSTKVKVVVCRLLRKAFGSLLATVSKIGVPLTELRQIRKITLAELPTKGDGGSSAVQPTVPVSQTRSLRSSIWRAVPFAVDNAAITVGVVVSGIPACPVIAPLLVRGSSVWNSLSKPRSRT